MEDGRESAVCEPKDLPMSANGLKNGNGNENGNGASAGRASAQMLSTRQGHPVYNSQTLRTEGNRGPAVLESYHVLEKITHFDRERIPEGQGDRQAGLTAGLFPFAGRV